ncbi:MAG: ABC transporter substrate-binding protein [Rhodobacteraceae bacterium]|nr:MAG: ABC transporter substrate-binding protein [Paracoccaceae bacterium]
MTLTPTLRGLFAASVAVASLSGAAKAAQPCIGASWELTGALAHTGLQIRYAVEVAIDEINAAGGVLGEQLVLRAYDDQGEPARAVDNALRIGEQDECVVMLGGFRTPNAIALREPLDEMGLPWVGVISAGTRVIEHETGENEWMFRVSMKDRWVAPFLVEQAVARAPSGRIGLFYEATGWGQGAVPDVVAAAEAQGVELVAQETFNIADTDMTAQLIRLRDAGAEALVFYGVDREADAILRSMERIDYRPTIVSAWGIGGQLGNTAGALSEGVLVAGTFSWWGELEPRAQAVLDAMKERFNLAGPQDLLLPSGTANAYDAVHIIARALEIAGEFDREKLRDAFYEVRHEGIVAVFDPAFERTMERHDAITPDAYRLFAFHNGVMLPLDQTPFGTN